MQPLLSVILCTHNPRTDYLERVLKALYIQNLPKNLWELLLIDNASDKLLSSEIDLNWHPNARHIREENLGLTPARIRGIKESVAETLVFVDDDNILDSDYLEVVVKINQDWPMLGAWGGQIRPEFEETPPDWTKPYWEMLALRKFERDQWSNLLIPYTTVPLGAGMCVRKVVAQKYLELLQKDPKRAVLGRKGKNLTSCEDIDMSLTSCDIGLGTGLFVSLKLTHIISASRLQESYLLKLNEGIGYSFTILQYCRGKIPNPYKFSWIISLLKYLYFSRERFNLRYWRFHNAYVRGQRLATQEISKLESNQSVSFQ